MNQEEITALIEEVLFGYHLGKMDKAKREKRQFVHYTRIENVLSLIENNEIWLRNSLVMNDYSEIAHGEACLNYVLSGDNETRRCSERVLNAISPGLHERARNFFEQGGPLRRFFTYILSISEHGPESIVPGVAEYETEAELGRLSMWRAYGTGGGVALVMNQKPFFSESTYLNAYSSPVFYGGPQTFAHEYEKTLTKIERHIEAIRGLPEGLFEDNLRRAIHFSTLTCKHPGFREEREWRVTYSALPANEHLDDAEFNAKSPMKREFRTINGTPQRIYKIPFVDYPEEGFEGATIPALLDRIIIGPSQYPHVARDAIYMALTRAGVPDAGHRILASGIPIRQ